MTWKAIQKISLGYKVGDVVPDDIAEDLNFRFEVSPVEKVDNKKTVSDEVIIKEDINGDGVVDKKDKSIVARIKDTAADLMDDGKRNYSNRKKKKNKK